MRRNHAVIIMSYQEIGGHLGCLSPSRRENSCEVGWWDGDGMVFLQKGLLLSHGRTVVCELAIMIALLMRASSYQTRSSSDKDTAGTVHNILRCSKLLKAN